MIVFSKILKNKQLINIVLIAVIVFIIWQIIKKTSFTIANTLPNVVTGDVKGATISDIQAEMYVKRVMDVLGFWSIGDSDVFDEMLQLTDNDLILINNIFINKYAKDYDYEYNNIAELIYDRSWVLLSGYWFSSWKDVVKRYEQIFQQLNA